jgi:hypothetical protein
MPAKKPTQKSLKARLMGWVESHEKLIIAMVTMLIVFAVMTAISYLGSEKAGQIQAIVDEQGK